MAIGIPIELTLTNILSAIFLVLTTTVAILIRDSRRANLSHIPGPFFARYTNAYSALSALRLSRARSAAAVASYSRSLERKYGLVVRTGPNTVTILDPHAIQLVYGVRSKLDKVGTLLNEGYVAKS